jgi:dTDP-4-amino-4,6-dideoxygalactose transaminase
MNVPLLDLKAQLEPLRGEIAAAVENTIDSIRYILGPEVEKLEEDIAQYSGTLTGIGVSSGTDALLAALMACGVTQGDLVLTTPYTFFATMGSILRLGAQPLFVDIDPVTYNIDPDKAAAILAYPDIAQKVKVLLPVHLYGQCADMSPLIDLAEEHDMKIVEDAAQAIGAAYPVHEKGNTVWMKAGSMGDAGCFSFFPSKNLGCMGDGGMIVSNNADMAEEIRVLRVHGGAPKYHHAVVGGNFRLDAIQAAILNVKFKYLSEWHAGRRRNAERYRHLFAEAGLAADGNVTLPKAVYEEEAGQDPDIDHHIYNQYVIRARERDELKAFLLSEGIGVEIYYPIPLHQQKCVSHLGLSNISYPEAEKAAAETLALPIYPELSTEMQEYVVDRIATFYKSR